MASGLTTDRWNWRWKSRLRREIHPFRWMAGRRAGGSRRRVPHFIGGRDPFGDLLERAADRQSVAGHPITIQRVAVVTRTAGCQVLYAAGSPDQPVADMLTAVRGTPVLTVTDQAPDAKSRGIVNFIISDDRVRFEIDAAAAEQNGLTISSKLLSLAVRVSRGNQAAADMTPLNGTLHGRAAVRRWSSARPSTRLSHDARVQRVARMRASGIAWMRASGIAWMRAFRIARAASNRGPATTRGA